MRVSVRVGARARVRVRARARVTVGVRVRRTTPRAHDVLVRDGEQVALLERQVLGRVLRHLLHVLDLRDIGRCTEI